MLDDKPKWVKLVFVCIICILMFTIIGLLISYVT
jgi:hypothetical protein